jgi:Ca2+-binding EF-hand superfamily protein
MKKLVAILGGLVLASGAAFAQDEGGTKSFEELDADQNGALTESEASADSTVAAVFSQADTNQDGYLTPTEFDAISGSGESEEMEESEDY